MIKSYMLYIVVFAVGFAIGWAAHILYSVLFSEDDDGGFGGFGDDD